MHQKYQGTWAHFLISLHCYRYFATLPVTTSSSERSFSALKFINRRSTMTDERSFKRTGSVVRISRYFGTLDYDAVIDEFEKSNRRL